MEYLIPIIINFRLSNHLENFQEMFLMGYEQAGFRAGQGCLNQIFILTLLVGHGKENNKKLYVCFMDYEKVFDFANRARIANQLMTKGCGKCLTSAITKTLSKSVYHPKISNSRLGEGIESLHGVTQGRKTSANLLSFYLSGMATAFKKTRYDDFMQPCDFAQLADDIVLYAEQLETLRSKCKEILHYSRRKYQMPNMIKTLYCEFTVQPALVEI